MNLAPNKKRVYFVKEAATRVFDGVCHRSSPQLVQNFTDPMPRPEPHSGQNFIDADFLNIDEYMLFITKHLFQLNLNL